MELDILLGDFVEQEHHDGVRIGSPQNHRNEIVVQYDNDISGKY